EIVTTPPNGALALAINNNCQVVVRIVGSQPGIYDQGAILQVDARGIAQSMLVLSPLPGESNSYASCINGLGQVAGGSGSRAVVWLNGPNANPTDLGALSKSQPNPQPLGINTVNGVTQVVGTDYVRQKGNRAFLWKNGVMTDLNSLISVTGVTLNEATTI